MAFFSIAGEGILDLAIGRKILIAFGHQIIAEYDKRGKDRLDSSLAGYFNASKHSPWFVLRDLDQKNCLVDLLQDIAPQRLEFPNLILRICVTSVESWLLADLVGFAQYFGISKKLLNNNPDEIINPKGALVRLVEKSRHRNLREGVVPRAGSGRHVGPEYNAVLSDYIAKSWDLERAKQHSGSLLRAVQRVEIFQG